MILPKAAISFPAVLAEARSFSQNGRLPGSLLQDCKPYGRLVKPAARSWTAMQDAALRDGIILYPTSAADTYRPYSVQEAVFRIRYAPGRPSSIDKVGRTWNGVRWYRQFGAAAAVPGTSNHGWGLAVDVAHVTQGGRFDWLMDNAKDFGFSWELDSERWHIRYVAGDRLPARVLAPIEEDELSEHAEKQIEEVHTMVTHLADAWFRGSPARHAEDFRTPLLNSHHHIVNIITPMLASGGDVQAIIDGIGEDAARRLAEMIFEKLAS